MTASGVTWIVVADGSGARVFEERVRLGPLTERFEMAAESHENRHRASAHGATVTSRVGPGRHGAGTDDPASRAEERFLTTYASRIDAAAEQGAFEHLVLIAPPQALGVLRGHLKAATTRRIEASDPHERLHETLESIQSRLQAVRAKT